MFFGFQAKELILRFQIDCYAEVHFLTGVVQKIFTVCLLSTTSMSLDIKIGSCDHHCSQDPKFHCNFFVALMAWDLNRLLDW